MIKAMARRVTRKSVEPSVSARTSISMPFARRLYRCDLPREDLITMKLGHTMHTTDITHNQVYSARLYSRPVPARAPDILVLVVTGPLYDRSTRLALRYPL